ncbi:sugar phosphate nucleotidyltransferase [Legionella dresdenensis]
MVDFARQIRPSNRGEYEITSINQIYLELNQLRVELLGRGFAWLDTGTYESLLEAGMFVQTIEHRQGFKIACLEEIAYKNGWLSEAELYDLAQQYRNNSYGSYLLSLFNETESVI